MAFNEQNNELIWESIKPTLILESFKDYITKKVSEGNGQTEVDDVVKQFKQLSQKQKIPLEHRDISKWMKLPFDDLKKFVEEASLILSKRDKKRGILDPNIIKQDPDVELVYSDERFVAFFVKNFHGSEKYGSETTNWCITKDEKHWEEYSEEDMIFFVFDNMLEPYNIAKDTGNPLSKLAFLLGGKYNVNSNIYNAADDHISMKDILGYKEDGVTYDDIGGQFSLMYDGLVEYYEDHVQEYHEERFNYYLHETTQYVADMDDDFEHSSISINGKDFSELEIVGTTKLEHDFDNFKIKKTNSVKFDVAEVLGETTHLSERGMVSIYFWGTGYFSLSYNSYQRLEADSPKTLEQLKELVDDVVGDILSVEENINTIILYGLNKAKEGGIIDKFPDPYNAIEPYIDEDYDYSPPKRYITSSSSEIPTNSTILYQEEINPKIHSKLYTNRMNRIGNNYVEKDLTILMNQLLLDSVKDILRQTKFDFYETEVTDFEKILINESPEILKVYFRAGVIYHHVAILLLNFTAMNDIKWKIPEEEYRAIIATIQNKNFIVNQFLKELDEYSRDT